MTHILSLTLLHEALCLALAYSIFCRAVRMTAQTLLPIRLSMFSLGAVGLLGLAAPLLEWRPDLFSLALLAAVVVVQITTSRYWRVAVPPSFERS